MTASSLVAWQVTQLSPMDAYRLCCDYLERCAAAPTHTRMVRGHVHKLITVRAGEGREEEGEGGQQRRAADTTQHTLA